MAKTHSFHIPVMGIGFTIDTPLKVSQFGINSVISIVDDILLEKLRKMYCGKYQLPYDEISEKSEDFRAKRITSYLNMINQLAEEKFEQLKNATQEKSNEIKEYFNMLPDTSSLKKEFKALTSKHFNINDIRNWLNTNMSMGSIDVNIMTKIDRDNYKSGEKLPKEFKDAHAALRGFAMSDLSSTLVLSAGMNPSLYAYLEEFEDFYPDAEGKIKKKIAIKVSDYRSALIQGMYMAKKGIWVSEYRIESGLNCGGHAFATDGYLMGPILNDFKTNRTELIEKVYATFVRGLESKKRSIPQSAPDMIVTAQGGVGTSEEHDFLMDHYQVDSVGWGTPFLLVPEATTIDEPTLEKLIDAKEEDLYLSGISPLGVPFNSLKGNTKDIEKISLIAKGKPGSACPKRYLVSNTEFTEKAICTASRAYQFKKLKELENSNLSTEEYQRQADRVLEKSCICVGLGTSALVNHNLDTSAEGEGISVCPGPNMAYFSKKSSLKEMIDHIYGRANLITRTDRPNMFVKELDIYIDYLKNRVEDALKEVNKREVKYLNTFVSNLKDGANYYSGLFSDLQDKFQDTKTTVLNDLDASLKQLNSLDLTISKLQPVVVKK